MDMVIKIDEYDKEWIDNAWDIPNEIKSKVVDAIKNGTPLPKGHGRLIDEKELIEEIECEEIDGSYYDVIYAHSIYDAPTIIEGAIQSE